MFLKGAHAKKKTKREHRYVAKTAEVTRVKRQRLNNKKYQYYKMGKNNHQETGKKIKATNLSSINDYSKLT